MEVAVKKLEDLEAEEEQEIIKPVGMVCRGKAYQPPSDNDSTTFSTITTTIVSTEDDGADSDTGNGSAESLNDEKVKEESRKGKSTNGNGISSLKNGDAVAPINHNGGNVPHIDLVVNREMIIDFKVNDSEFRVSAVKSHQDKDEIVENEDLNGFSPLPSKTSLPDQNGSSTSFGEGTSKHGRIKLRNKHTEEADELYLEELYEKEESHEFYCPNCKTCITKVIIRERIVERPPDPEEFRCTSCFSFLIPVGNWIINTFKHKKQGVPVPPNERLVEPLVSHNSNVEPAHQIPREPPTITEPVLSHNSNGKAHDLNEKAHDLNKKPHDPNATGKITVTVTAPSGSATAAPREPPLIDVGEGKSDVSGPAIPVNPDVSITITPAPVVPLVGITEQSGNKIVEILKSIVYGGLTESITSLGIVTSAASAHAATVSIVALALANLIGGLFTIGHNVRKHKVAAMLLPKISKHVELTPSVQLWELKNDQSKVPSEETGEQVYQYEEKIGKKENFMLHAPFAILSFLVFGLVPPIVYGFSFRESNDRDLKLAALGVASLVCITLLAVAKANIQRPHNYIKTVAYYIVLGFGVSGLSYAAGDLVNKLLEELGWFHSGANKTLSLPGMGPVKPAWQSY
ncbi:hypothetical protein FNV43_RR23041 [Rhamnella rubrinervis]|uniref:Membrane protein of ER body-like protein n=1 Tax=Rhamnella rubrinervis TaxID=2594499 RepID=A0A8K0DXR9_9ROSA|nr:hypothetical protein FNV43_RR23041 [Rhamnella rubrinervis]